MRTRTIFSTTIVALVLAAVSARADTDVNVGVSFDDDGVSGFHLAVAQHYRVDRKAVITYRKRSIPDDHLPVVFFLAARAEVSPELVVKMRLGGKSWMDIGLHFGLGADIFYVPVTRDYGPPYGRALGHFKKKKRSHWAAIRLSDVDVVTLVNIKFLAAHHGVSADEIIRSRQGSDTFIKIHGRIKVRGASRGKGFSSKHLKPGKGPHAKKASPGARGFGGGSGSKKAKGRGKRK